MASLRLDIIDRHMLKNGLENKTELGFELAFHEKNRKL